MKARYRLFLRRKTIYYAFDTVDNKFQSLKTKDKHEARGILAAMNQASQQPAMNLSLARVYLRHSDPHMAKRTWQNVLDEIIQLKIYHQVPPKVEYSLSEYGKSLKPVLEAMAAWGSEHRLKRSNNK